MGRPSDKVLYDDSKILTLSATEHIRRRPGMYIGRLGNGSSPEDGIYILLKEIIDNSIDEFVMGYGSVISVTIADKTVTVRDYGRGIPQGKLVDCVSEINTGGKFNSDVFQFSVGLNGVGAKAVNALSSYFKASTYRDGECVSAEFAYGKLTEKKKRKNPDNTTGTEITFIPDSGADIFGDYSFNAEYVEKMIQNYVWLNAGLTIEYNGKKYKSKDGLKDLLDSALGKETPLYQPCHYVSKDKKVEFAFTHVKGMFGEDFFSYANGQYTRDGGTHQSYFKEALAKTIADFYKKNWAPQVVREGIIAAIAVKVQEPRFDSQTKSKLTNTEIRQMITDEVKEAVTDFLLKNPVVKNNLAEKINLTEKMHKEIAEVKKSAKEVSGRIRYNIPSLKDCKYHLNQGAQKIRENEGPKTMIFITEGNSAAGSLTQTRDVYHQAVFALRGKVLNTYGCKKTELYKNAELYNLTSALGIEDSIDNLRYEKIIIATDADVDGMHIQILLLTFFLTFFPDLVTSGRVYILETPLFRVRNKQVTEYCYSEAERDEAAKKISKCEITRFKGLGEISPGEFKDFIGMGMRLNRVELSAISDITDDVAFYMGHNTPERRQFVTENLI